MCRCTVGIAVIALAALVAPFARAQAVAFQPVVRSFPNGVTMSGTPVVSADRRYVRLTVNPQFTALNGFDTFAVPGAVSGGPGGALPGGLAGLNGPLGGAGRQTLPAAAVAPVAGGQSASDPFATALARYSDGSQLRAVPDPDPRGVSAAVRPKRSRRREIIRKRP